MSSSKKNSTTTNFNEPELEFNDINKNSNITTSDFDLKPLPEEYKSFSIE